MYAQLERARITASGASVGTQPPPPDTTPARVLSPMVSHTSSRQLPHIPDATSSAIHSTSFSVTAPDFSPAFTACLLIGGITPSVYTSPRLAVTFGGSVFVCSSSSNVFTTSTTSTPMRSSPSMDLPVSATTVYPPLATFAKRLPTSAISASLVQPATNQLPPISKFKEEDPDQEGGNFEECIEQFELIAEAYGWDSRAKLVNLTTKITRASLHLLSNLLT